MPCSKLPFWRWNSRLTIGAARMWSNRVSLGGKSGFESDQVTFSARAALTATSGERALNRFCINDP